MQKKLWVVYGVFCILSVVLVGRLMYINRTSGARYEKQVLSQQDYSSSVIPYQRGDIVDRKGTVLATSIDTYNVILDCKVLNQYPEDIDATVAAICGCFSEIPEEQVRSALSERADSPYVILVKHVDFAEMQAFTEMQEDEKTAPHIHGVWFEKEYVRQYPYGELAASVIGFTGGNTGVIGLENYYNDVLNGVNGRSYGYVNMDSDIEKTVIDPVDGYRIVSTIDINVAAIVHEEIEKWNREHLREEGDVFGSVNTAVIVMNPNNGEIYAMEDYPFFDLNKPRDLSAFYSPETFAEMTKDMTDEERSKYQSDFLNGLWNNYTISSTYEPGSTAKPFTVAAGLETGTLSGDETYYCNGGEIVSGHTIKCVKVDGHGRLTVSGSLEQSCNDALMQIAAQVGPANFAKYQRIFGFGQRTGIDLPGEAQTASLIYSEEDLSRTASNLATNSFGQNFNVTMVQLASAYCSLVNGGILYQPHIVSQIQDREGNVISTVAPVELKRTISAETSMMESNYLRAVVEKGTGRNAAVSGYSMGGKTGTAEMIPRADQNYLVSYICNVPAEHPEVVIYCVIDRPNADDQAQSRFAVDLARNIAERILPYLNVTAR